MPRRGVNQSGLMRPADPRGATLARIALMLVACIPRSPATAVRDLNWVCVALHRELSTGKPKNGSWRLTAGPIRGVAEAV